MEIRIHQEIFSLPNSGRYKIFENDKLKFIAKNKLWDFDSTTVFLYDLNEIEILQVSRNYNWFKSWVIPEFFIRYTNFHQIEIKTISIFKRHFQAIDNTDLYDMYEHRGRKLSLFKNDRQIATIKYKGFSVLNENEYLISANDNESVKMLSSFCLMIYIFKNNGKKGIVNFTFGYLGSEKMKFDNEWKPNTQ